MNVFNDIVKIVNQIRGKENIFGYKSTIANQFYLVYCFIGEIYFSTKFHRHTKFFMFSWQIAGISVTIFQQVSYILYGDMNDIAALLHSTLITLTVLATHIIIPYFSVIRYRSNLQDAIEIADHIIMRKKSVIHKPNDELNIGKLLKYISVFHIVTVLIFCLICNLNIVLFYEEEKVQNHVYYLVYVPRLDLYGSFPFFLIFNTVVGFAAIAVYLSWLMVIFMLVFCAVIFYDEMLRIAENLNFPSLESMTIESYKLIEPKFKDTIIKCTRDFQNAIKMFECFREFYETLSTLILPTTLNIQITSAFLFVSPDISNTVRLRELSVLLTSIQMIYMLCWVGKMVNESVEAVSFAVYSTPWYWSTSLRKDVYILLCQTQRPISGKALGVYPLCLATFLRFMNVVQSSVNVLRTITSK